MRVGLTYDLREDYLALGMSEDDVAELDKVETIEALEEAIGSFGHTVERIGHVRALVERLAAGDRWDLVFNIAEGLSGFGREATVPALLEAYGIPCTFSDALACALTLHKGMCKHVLRDRGVPTPPFAVVERAEDATTLALPFPLFVKPVAEGTSKGVEPASKVTTPAALVARCGELIARYRQPALVETFLPGWEVTVGVVGTGPRARALGVLEVKLLAGAEQEIYSYDNKDNWRGRVDYALATGPRADEAKRIAVAAWNALGCRDGGRVDLRADAAGALHVLEINPLPGINPVYSDLPILCRMAGIAYRDLIGEILASARERVPAAAHARA